MSSMTKKQPIDHMGVRGKRQAKYILLSANNELSPNNQEEVKALTSDENKDGQLVKIVLGNVVASEGLDFKNIRRSIF